jgi:hypothetical protein
VNFLEQLVAEWYKTSGYIVRRNVRVGKLAHGGHEGELDVVAFHPEQKRLVHIEASMDRDTWDRREERFARKFRVGRDHSARIFVGFGPPYEHGPRAALGLARVYHGKRKDAL